MKETRWGPIETWWWSNGMNEGDPLGTNRDMVVEQWVKEGDSLGAKRDVLVEQWDE